MALRAENERLLQKLMDALALQVRDTCIQPLAHRAAASRAPGCSLCSWRGAPTLQAQAGRLQAGRQAGELTLIVRRARRTRRPAPSAVGCSPAHPGCHHPMAGANPKPDPNPNPYPNPNPSPMAGARD